MQQFLFSPFVNSKLFLHKFKCKNYRGLKVTTISTPKFGEQINSNAKLVLSYQRIMRVFWCESEAWVRDKRESKNIVH